jgi:hypothetical protein
MRPHLTIRLLAVLAVLLLGAVPVLGDDHDVDPDPTPPEEPELVECAPSDDGLEVITRDGLASDIASPSFLIGRRREAKQFLVDLSPATEHFRAAVTTTMTWSVAANDYDLAVTTSLGSGETEAFQPFDPPIEELTLSARHCDVITVEAIDYLAPVVVDSIELGFAVRNVREVVPAP